MAPDPRVEREAAALGRAGYRVTVLAWDRSGELPVREARAHFDIVRIPLPAPYGEVLRGIPALLRWHVALTRRLLRRRGRLAVVHACDFDTVLPAVALKRTCGWKVVYDVFDAYADMHVGLPGAVREAIRLWDRWAARRVDAVILPDPSRLATFGAVHLPRVEVVRNSPEDRFGGEPPVEPPAGGPFRIAYVGVLAKERGLRQLLGVVSRHRGWELDLAGFGREEAEIRRAALRHANVRFHGRVSYERALELAASAHAMVATYDPAVPNHRFSSPNKLYEAALLGKPLIVAQGTGVDREVTACGLGFAVPYGDLDALEGALEAVGRWTEEERRTFSEQARRVYRSRFAWSIMEQRLVRLYTELLEDRVPAR